jgi:D-alanyl-lipoteichoic acid acyltransferase DltB (MBOAT superfamily)
LRSALHPGTADPAGVLFNSFEFLVFFAVFIGLWRLVRDHRQRRWAYIVAASLFFYGWWDWRFIFLIIGSGLIDFAAGLAMAQRPAWRKPALVLSILANVGSLAIFKYLDFGLGTTNRLLGALGIESAVPLAYLPLPIGISFYTFQSMSYTIDVYAGRLTPTRNPLHFFAYLAMFPQLVAGPIVRAADLLPQLAETRRPTDQQRWTGLKLILCGYAKKVIVADHLGPVVNAAFASSDPAASAAFWWLIMVMFAFQIYCDFSGYSDIARGLARWMGYDFGVNFDHPYIAGSFREFWTRWHISLSTWFRDYVYVPLGGSRGGTWRGHRNMWITMLLSGFWHGAAWTMLLWGALHALYLSAERATDWPARLQRLPGGRHLATLIVFLLVVLAWVPFRATSATQCLQIMAAMFNFSSPDFATARAAVGDEHVVLLVVMILRQLYFYAGCPALLPARPVLRGWGEPVAVACLLWACVYLRGPTQAFIYFQF